MEHQEITQSSLFQIVYPVSAWDNESILQGWGGKEKDETTIVSRFSCILKI